MATIDTSARDANRPTEGGAAAAVAAYLRQHETKGLLRFITCGSVDDGKSTLIGRLLYESKGLFEDQLAALDKDSRRHGTQATRSPKAWRVSSSPSAAVAKAMPLSGWR